MTRLASFQEICRARSRSLLPRYAIRLRRDASSKPQQIYGRNAKLRLHSEPQREQRKTFRNRYNDFVNHPWWGHVLPIAEIIAYSSLIVPFTFHFIVSPRPVAGPSMQPTLAFRDDWVLISYLHPRFLAIQPGDLISFENPMHPGERSIKRVIGLPGDLVLRDTPPGSPDNFWIEADPARWEAEGKSKQHGPGWMIRVPEGHCWVVGDNLPWSRDSRHFGPLPLGLVKGRVLARIAPWKYREWYRRSTVFEDVD